MAGIKKKDWTKGHEIGMEELEKACEEKKGENNMTKEELLTQEKEELNKRIKLLEKAVEIKDKKIEYFQAVVNTMAEHMEELTEHTSGYISQLEETIRDLI